MKKALQVSLAQTLFTLEEDAYSRLLSYLESIKAHFATTDGGADIVADIEGRIAEQFLESKRSIITLVEVEKVITSMGLAEDLDGKASEPAQEKQATKKLYRDTDNAVIGGVSAGLAKYLGIDPLWIRIIFLILFFSSGFGFILYVILWIAIPEAKTPSQKLEMSGSPVNIGTLSETVKEKVEEVSAKHGGKVKRGLNGFFKAMRTIVLGFAKRVVPILRAIIAIAFSIASVVGLVGLSIFAAILATASPERYTDFPLTEVIPLTHAYGIVATGYLALLIPLFFVLMFALSLLRRKNLVSAPFGFGLLGLWCISVILLGSFAFNSGLSYAEYIRNNPRYEEIATVVPLDGTVTGVSAIRGTNLSVIQGTGQSLIANGRPIDLEKYEVRLKDGTLTLGNRTVSKECIFCDRRSVRYVLTVPAITKIEARNGSYAEATVSQPTISLAASSGSSIRISGSASSTIMTATNGSDIDAQELVSGSASVDASSGSSVLVHATDKLEAKAEYGSSVRYEGAPAVTKDARGGSDIEPLKIDAWQE